MWSSSLAAAGRSLGLSLTAIQQALRWILANHILALGNTTLAEYLVGH